MTIPLTGAGSLFVRWGHLAGRMLDLDALRGGTATARVLAGASFPTTFATVETDYANGTALYQVIEGIQLTLGSFYTSNNSFMGSLGTTAQKTLQAMYAIDQGLSSSLPLASLTTTDATTCLKELIRQMTSASASIQSSTVAAGAQTALGSPTGTPIIVVSVKDPAGRALQYSYPETLTIKCTGDKYNTPSIAGNEPFLVLGQPALSDPPYNALWPLGSGISQSVSAADGSKSNSTGNALQNSDFFTATTANVPDNWTLRIGSAGTDIFQTTSGTYTTGGGALQFTGTGGALLDAVTQSFNTTPSTTVGAGGTTYALKPSTVYHVNGWVKVSATPAAGVLELALIDGSAYPGTVINDDAGTANLFTKSLTAVSTSYVNFSGAFRTPSLMPATTPYQLRLRLSTAIDSGKSAFIGRVTMVPATELYAGGPFLSIHSGNTNVVNGPYTPDTWTVAITNTEGVFARFLDRVFGLKALRLIIPNNGSPTISDSLCV